MNLNSQLCYDQESFDRLPDDIRDAVIAEGLSNPNSVRTKWQFLVIWEMTLTGNVLKAISRNTWGDYDGDQLTYEHIVNAVDEALSRERGTINQ